MAPNASAPAFVEKLLPALAGSLAHHAGNGGLPERPRRVFVNRNLRLQKIRFVGFDLDWTLADYRRDALDPATFDLALHYLVEEMGYPEAIRQVEFRPGFPRRGLIVDRQIGAVLKMNRHRYVGRAYLGRTRLSSEERSRLYRLEPIDLASERYYFLDTLFELPEVNLFAELVELGRRGVEPLASLAPSELFVDVRRAVDSVHANGSLKSRIVADLPRFVRKDPELPLALARLALGGRRLFLVTNSDGSYTDTICSYLFDRSLPGLESWRELFDLVVVAAQKPSFFKRERAFATLGPDGGEGEPVAVPSWGGLYAGGSREGLMKLFEAPGEQVLYVGDHLYSDVLSSKRSTAWRTALIVRELEEELATSAEVGADLRHLIALREELSDLGHRMDDLRDAVTVAARRGEPDGAAAERLATLEQQHRALRQRAGELQERTSRRYHPIWGPLFKQGSNQSLFAAQVNEYACLYTSRVSNFASYGTNHYFRVVEDPMGHELAG